MNRLLLVASFIFLGCFNHDAGPTGFPPPSAQCTPEESQESFDCEFYGFKFQGKRSHGLAPDEYTGAYADGDKTMCGCKHKLLADIDQANQQHIEPIVKQPCKCTRRH